MIDDLDMAQTTSCIEYIGNIISWFLRNSEADASEFIENPEEIFPWCLLEDHKQIYTDIYKLYPGNMSLKMQQNFWKLFT